MKIVETTTGNLLTYGSKNYEWDYRNRLASSTESGANTIYKYDHTEQRVKKTNGATTTLYPNKYYETTGATSTRYIWAGDELVATISGGQSTTTSYIHPDHLGSMNAVTSELAYVVKTLDYYPYGSERIATGTPEVSRTYIGQFSDAETDMSYLNARYLQNERGQFISQDPVFWEIDKTPDGKKALTNPQAQNSYSYAGNNPIVNKDPYGRWWEVSGSIVIPGRAFSTGLRFDGSGADFFIAGGFGYGAGGGLEVAWAPGAELSHQPESNINVGGQFAYIAGGRVTQNLLTYSPDQKKRVANGGPTGAVVFGAGGGVYIQEELSSPVPFLTWGNRRTNSSIQNQTSNQNYISGPSNQTYQNPSANYSRNITPVPSSGNSSSVGQSLMNLQSALSRLSATLRSLIRR